MAKSKCLTLLISEELHSYLKNDAADKNISVASVVRMACSEYLKKEQKK